MEARARPGALLAAFISSSQRLVARKRCSSSANRPGSHSAKLCLRDGSRHRSTLCHSSTELLPHKCRPFRVPVKRTRTRSPAQRVPARLPCFQPRGVTPLFVLSLLASRVTWTTPRCGQSPSSTRTPTSLRKSSRCTAACTPCVAGSLSLGCCFARTAAINHARESHSYNSQFPALQAPPPAS